MYSKLCNFTLSVNMCENEAGEFKNLKGAFTFASFFSEMGN